MFSDVEQAIAVINMEECYRRRVVRGRDFNEWHEHLDELIGAGELAPALALLDEIIEATHTLVQYDDREPHHYWAERSADLHMLTGDQRREADTLRRWLAAWPDDRVRHDRARERITARLATLDRATV